MCFVNVLECWCVVCIEMGVPSYTIPLMQYNKVAIGETTSFYVAAMDELLHNASVVFATEGGLDLQVC